MMQGGKEIASLGKAEETEGQPKADIYGVPSGRKKKSQHDLWRARLRKSCGLCSQKKPTFKKKNEKHSKKDPRR